MLDLYMIVVDVVTVLLFIFHAACGLYFLRD